MVMLRALVVSVAVVFIGCGSPAPEKVCGHAAEVSATVPAQRCREVLAEEKDKKPQDYDRDSKCIMESKNEASLSECLKIGGLRFDGALDRPGGGDKPSDKACQAACANAGPIKCTKALECESCDEAQKGRIRAECDQDKGAGWPKCVAACGKRWTPQNAECVAKAKDPGTLDGCGIPAKQWYP